MANLLAGIVLVLGSFGIAWAVRRAQVRRLSMDRLRESPTSNDEAAPSQAAEEFVLQVFARRHYLLPWILAGLVFAALWGLVSIPLVYALTLSVIFGLLSVQADSAWLAWRQDRIENQLADAIDLMVAAIKVGSSIQNALEYAAQDARDPLHHPLEEIVGRIRYGDDPQEVMEQLTE